MKKATLTAYLASFYVLYMDYIMQPSTTTLRDWYYYQQSIDKETEETHTEQY